MTDENLRSRLGPRSWLIVLNAALYIGFRGYLGAHGGSPPGECFIDRGVVGRGAPRGDSTHLSGDVVWGRWKSLMIGVTAAGALAVYSFVAFGAEAMVPSGGRLGFPFRAYLEHPSLWGFLLAIAAIATLAFGIRARDWSWVMAAVFVLCFGLDVLRDPINAWRASEFLPVLWASGTNHRIDSKGSLQPEPSTADVA